MSTSIDNTVVPIRFRISKDTPLYLVESILTDNHKGLDSSGKFSFIPISIQNAESSAFQYFVGKTYSIDLPKYKWLLAPPPLENNNNFHKRYGIFMDHNGLIIYWEYFLEGFFMRARKTVEYTYKDVVIPYIGNVGTDKPSAVTRIHFTFPFRADINANQHHNMQCIMFRLPDNRPGLDLGSPFAIIVPSTFIKYDEYEFVYKCVYDEN